MREIIGGTGKVLFGGVGKGSRGCVEKPMLFITGILIIMALILSHCSQKNGAKFISLQRSPTRV